MVPAGRAGLGRGSPSAALLTLACGRVLVAEILVLGTGDRVERLHPAMLKQMRECGIAVEVQDTVRRGVQRGTRRQRPSEGGRRVALGALPCTPGLCLPGDWREGGGYVPCGEGLHLLPEDWSFTPSLFYFTAKCVRNLQLPNK